MNARLSLLCGTMTVLAIAACSGPKEDPSASAPPATTVAATATTTAALALTVEGPPMKPGIELHVKAEIDTRTDGITGSPLVVPGARASLQTATGWTTTKGDVIVVAPADKKAQLAATSFATGGAEGKLPAVATALGLTACEWNPPDTLSIGKTAVAGNGADGRCMRGATPVQAAFVAAPAEGILVVGAWEAGGDSANLFGAMRSIVRVAGPAGGGLGPCCAALHQNGNNAPPDQKAMYMQAAAICDGLKNAPQAQMAIGQIRAALKSASMPSSCR
jgi:hypothetical protein